VISFVNYYHKFPTHRLSNNGMTGHDVKTHSPNRECELSIGQ